MNEIWEYEKYCSDIKDYFYGRYSSIKVKRNLVQKMNIKNKLINMFYSKDGIASYTHSVLSIYNTVKKSRSDLVNKINTYQKQKQVLIS